MVSSSYSEDKDYTRPAKGLGRGNVENDEEGLGTMELLGAEHGLAAEEFDGHLSQTDHRRWRPNP